MDKLREFARLNLAIEFVSECAGLADTDAIARVVGERLRWMFDFDDCVLALRVEGRIRWLSMRSSDTRLSAMPDTQSATGRTLAESVLSSGAPAASGRPMLAIAHPLGGPDRPPGALCIEGSWGYSHRDLRFLHHLCSGLGTALSRIEQSEQLAAARALAAARDRAARDEAQAANDAKDAFLAMLGHELRNPLAPIISAAELLRRSTSGPSIRFVEIVERQARHLDRLVGDLLDVSRVTTGKVSLRRSSVDLREIASKAAEMVRPRMLTKNQTLTMDLAELPVMVHGDEARLAQVTSNLLSNASAYSPSGSPVELRVWAGMDDALLEVRDRGIGIVPGMLRNIFDLFVQGGRSTEWAPGGLGLGLGVARALVELHGGSISAASDGEGLGSSFRFAIPLLSEDASKPGSDGSGETEHGSQVIRERSRRVLLVDDNTDAADSMGDLLRAAGHEVVVVYGPLDALAVAKAFASEVAVLDIGLPVMNGYQLANELRQRLGIDAPAMIALSGYGQDRDRERSLACGFADHLVKPPGLRALLASIQAACMRVTPEP